MCNQVVSKSAGDALKVLVLVWALLAASSGYGAPSAEWKVALNQEGIKVLTRQVPGSAYKEYKGITTVPASAASVMAIFTDQGANKQWLEGCWKARTIEESGFHSQTAYQVYDFPWPATDRDFVIGFEIKQTGENAFFLRMHDRSAQVPEKTDRVRAEMPSGYYEVNQLSPDRTEVVMAQHVDPNGDLPSWMVSSLVTDTPYYSLKRLRRMVTDKKYANAAFMRDDEGRVTSVRH